MKNIKFDKFNKQVIPIKSKEITNGKLKCLEF
jgi:hypothetical protein